MKANLDQSIFSDKSNQIVTSAVPRPYLSDATNHLFVLGRMSSIILACQMYYRDRFVNWLIWIPLLYVIYVCITSVMFSESESESLL